jgi:archaemetzincin
MNAAYKSLTSISGYFVLVLCIYSCSDRNAAIGIQPFKGVESHFIDTIKIALHQTYNKKTFVLPEIEVPKSTFINVKSPRYRADLLLKYLKDTKNDSISILLGILNQDVSITKKDGDGKAKMPLSKYIDWGIMGLAYMPGESCVVSTFRLRTKNQKLFFTRLKKVSIHEVGHNLGLDHCSTPYCVMQDAAETIKTIDNVSMELCPKCRSKI